MKSCIFGINLYGEGMGFFFRDEDARAGPGRGKGQALPYLSWTLLPGPSCLHLCVLAVQV